MQLNSKQIIAMISIEQENKSITNPPEFIKSFKDINDFREWALDKSIKKLKVLIDNFQKHELYEHCAVMLKLIDDLR